MATAQTHYMVTMPDGTVPPTAGPSSQYPTVNLADHIGQVVDHPTPSKRWHDETAFSYFRTYTQRGVGEILERRRQWPHQWPVRLWIVEPLGETGNWGSRHDQYWVLCHQLKVGEETASWRAFGDRGWQVWNLIENQLPELARQWAQEWQTDPDGTRHRYDTWTQRLHDTQGVSCWARIMADRARWVGAMEVAQELASAAAENAAAVTGADPGAVTAVTRRARCYTTGQLLHDRLGQGDFQKCIRALLLGAGLGTDALVKA
ncbi:hypothetical protein [Streptomyces sp. Tue6028]|uniref:hypothetical protein n=1 Tax=Streptomyces sp. Tue6028 TaxID=2036037 RepID=UPI003D72977B